LYEIVIFEAAEKFLDSLGDEAWHRCIRLLDILAQDPKVDGRIKVFQPVPPAVFSLYADPEFWILYHIVRNVQVSVLNIDYAGAKVTPWR